MTNKFKTQLIIALTGVMLGLGGCVSVGPTNHPQQVTGTADFAYKLAKDGSGILYGLVNKSPFDHDITTVKFVCDLINNTDERCAHPDDYMVGQILPRSEFSQGIASVLILMEKGKEIEPCWNYSNNKTCTYVKVQTAKGKFGTVLEVVSRPGEDKCYWSGGGVGGVVCPGWDSAKEVREFTAERFGITSVKE